MNTAGSAQSDIEKALGALVATGDAVETLRRIQTEQAALEKSRADVVAASNEANRTLTKAGVAKADADRIAAEAGTKLAEAESVREANALRTQALDAREADLDRLAKELAERLAAVESGEAALDDARKAVEAERKSAQSDRALLNARLAKFKALIGECNG